ncbi:SUMF1/EgtB/PvdO family nonheme iron enzyme [Adonisia turfae]|uniref:TIR domain-containing protein n=1 Tax=Adonisia turfae CCMR0081 TaxID=2292702 RepID=A0A6M0RCS7_9CYAN|nr:TIR domain-containing protein [Adonisia turfae CCMR0081]
MTKDFFISYNSADRQWAEWIAYVLEEHGYSVIIQAWDFRPGGNFILDMQKATAEAKRTVMVLSDAYLQALYTQPEWAAAFQQDPMGSDLKLLPIRVVPCQPQGMLAAVVYIDFVGKTAEEAEQLLLTALEERAKPTKRPAFPDSTTSGNFKSVVASPLETQKSPGPPLSKYSYNVVTVNDKGMINSQQQKTTEYFRENLGDNVYLDMVKIPSDHFSMGASRSDRHRVKVPSFFMSKYPITQEQWKFISRLDSSQDISKEGEYSYIKYKMYTMRSNTSLCKDNRLPVENICWFEAVEFCTRLSKLTNRQYRLPSEAEWEYACRAGTTSYFHFGNCLTPDLASYLPYSLRGWRLRATIVGRFPANNFGLYDMHGNVWEWCQDTWHQNYQGAPNDGSARDSKNFSSHKVIRGGAWYCIPRLCRSTYRHRFDSMYSDHSIGFRICCSFP